MSFDWDVWYMVKQGSNCYNLTRTYKDKRKAVSFASLDEIDEVETSSLCGKLAKRKPIVKRLLSKETELSRSRISSLTHPRII